MEQELKFALSRQAYEKLAALCTAKPTALKLQRNTYLDTDDFFLKKHGAGLRVRVENGKRAFLTLKRDVPQTEKGAREGWHQRQEWENRIPLVRAKALVKAGTRIRSLPGTVGKQFKKTFPSVVLSSLTWKGTLENFRVPIPVGRFLGELDRWTVEGRVFYELEIETVSRAKALAAVRKLFRQNGIPMRPRSTTKLAALFRYNKSRRSS